MASILITGASGFLGSHLIGGLVADGHSVYAVMRRISPTPPGAIVIEADLATFDRFIDRLPAHIDAVIHLAQSRNYRRFPECASDIMAVNVQATALLSDYARKAGATHFIFTSSGGIYGHNDTRVVETTPASPLNYYLASKYAAELLLTNYRDLFHTIVLRPFFIYGPGQSGMLVSNLITKVQIGEKVVIDGDPGLRINPIFVSDAITALRACLTIDHSAVLNLCGDDTVTLTELVGMIGAAVGKIPRLIHRPIRNPGDLVGDNTSMKSQLGIGALTSLADGLRQTAAGHAL